MRISQDAYSWRAESVLRRDFRAAHDEPEVPRPGRAKSHRRSTPVHCSLSPGAEHSPEYWTSEKRSRFVRDEVEWLHITTTTKYRCRWCHTTEMAPRLLGPVANIIGDVLRQKMLASYWCRAGHLYDIRYPDFPKTTDPWRQRYYARYFRPEKWCVMCGWSSGRTRAIADPGLLKGAGVPQELIDSMCSVDGSLRFADRIVSSSMTKVAMPEG